MVNGVRELEPVPVSFNDLALLAMDKAKGEERWDEIDRQLPRVADIDEVLIEAAGRLRDKDEDVRDLAASVFEQTSKELTEHVLIELRNNMHDDPHPYARYRAAFALFRQGERTKDLIGVIKEAKADPATQGVAQDYLDQFEKEKNENPDA